MASAHWPFSLSVRWPATFYQGRRIWTATRHSPAGPGGKDHGQLVEVRPRKPSLSRGRSPLRLDRTPDGRLAGPARPAKAATGERPVEHPRRGAEVGGGA